MSIAIIGLGYVGLPLANAFANKHSVVGVDINFNRINELNNFFDKTLELSHVSKVFKIEYRQKDENQ